MARFLKTMRNPHHDAIAIGWAYNNVGTIAMLCEWADLIIVMTRDMVNRMPGPFHRKIKVCDVGDDRYHDPMHPDLQQQCRAFADQEGL